MTKEVFEHLYVGKATHCKTRKRAKEFLKMADDFGYLWATANSLLEKDNWEEYGYFTCYYLWNDNYDYKNVSYCSRQYYLKHGYQVVEFGDNEDGASSKVNTLTAILREALDLLEVGKVYDMTHNIIRVDVFIDLVDARNLIQGVIASLNKTEKQK